MDRPDPNYVAWMEWHESIMSDTHGATKSIVSPRTHKLRLAEEMKRPLTNGKALSPRLRTPRARFGSKATTLLRDASRPPEELTSPSMLSVSSLGASGRAQAAEWPVRPLSGRMLRTRQQLAPGGMAKNMGAPNSARWMQRASSPDGGDGDSPPSSPLLQTFQFPPQPTSQTASPPMSRLTTPGLAARRLPAPSSPPVAAPLPPSPPMTRLTTPMTPSMAREYSPSTTASVSLNAPQHPWTCLCTACRNAFDLNEGLARKRPTATVHGWPQRLREIRATVSATMQSDNDGALLSVLDSLLEPQHPRRAQPEVDAPPEPEVEALMRAGHLHPLGEDSEQRRRRIAASHSPIPHSPSPPVGTRAGTPDSWRQGGGSEQSRPASSRPAASTREQSPPSRRGPPSARSVRGEDQQRQEDGTLSPPSMRARVPSAKSTVASKPQSARSVRLSREDPALIPPAIKPEDDFLSSVLAR